LVERRYDADGVEDGLPRFGDPASVFEFGVEWVAEVPEPVLGAALRMHDRHSWLYASGGGLIGLLVLFAGLALLFTSRYPQSLYNLVLGLNRWVFRVVAYAGLMTDTYPPFRLDTGSTEPPAATGTSTVPTTPTPIA
jgi:hypothetical protein